MANSIDFETAVAESLLLANSNSKNYIRLGEIGACVKTVYGAKTLNQLAKQTGIAYASFKCYVAVYRAFESDAVLLASSSFGVLQSLATHPDRAAILSANPTMPRAAARKLARDYKRSVTPELSPTQKLGAAFARVDRALNPLRQLSAAMTSSSDAAAAIDQLVNARDNLQTVLAKPADCFVLPDPDFADLAEPVEPEPAAVYPVVAPDDDLPTPYEALCASVDAARAAAEIANGGPLEVDADGVVIGDVTPAQPSGPCKLNHIETLAAKYNVERPLNKYGARERVVLYCLRGSENLCVGLTGREHTNLNNRAWRTRERIINMFPELNLQTLHEFSTPIRLLSIDAQLELGDNGGQRVIANIKKAIADGTLVPENHDYHCAEWFPENGASAHIRAWYSSGIPQRLKTEWLAQSDEMHKAFLAGGPPTPPAPCLYPSYDGYRWREAVERYAADRLAPKIERVTMAAEADEPLSPAMQKFLGVHTLEDA